jgi:DNA repair protein RadC
VGIIVDVLVIDHLIISTTSQLSFADIGLLAELEKSTKYVPKYVLEERIRKHAETVVKKKNSIEIAKQLKRKGIDNQTIAEATGLPLEEVEQLKVRKTNSK